MQTTYSDFHIQIDNNFGDEFVSFFIFAHRGERKAYFSVLLHYLRRFLSTDYPKEAAYINQIRDNLGGYGPKEKEILEVLQEEEFDFQKHLIAYLESEEGLIEAEMERQQKLYENPENKQKIIAGLTALNDAVPINPVKSSQFLDGLEKAILTYLIDNYPELTEGKAEDIRKLNSILSRAIPNFGGEIIDLIEEIRANL
jgi:hypothetical protein